MSPSETHSLMARAFSPLTAERRARSSASNPGSPAPWIMLWIRFVRSKKRCSSLSITTHSHSTPSSCRRVIMVGSISATPPPCSVELTIQTFRSWRRGTTSAASDRSSRTAGTRWATAS